MSSRRGVRPAHLALRVFFSAGALILPPSPGAGQEAGAVSTLEPVPFSEVELTSSFWRPRLVTQREILVPFAFERTQPGVAHLEAARDFLAGKGAPGHRPHRFIDSDQNLLPQGGGGPRRR
jgi:hypothetical protein